MPARLNVELIAVPWANDVRMILREGEAEAGLIVRDQLLHAGDDLTLAYRPAHVRADILPGRERTVPAKHADGDAVDLDHFSAGIRKIVRGADHNVPH